MHQGIAQHMDFLRERAGQRAAGTARGRFGAGIDEVGNRLGLGQVDLVVEGALGELAGLGQTQPVSTGLPSSLALCAASRQRASSSCSTTGPPWACSSSTSSPV
jgi:hypothetical protein